METTPIISDSTSDLIARIYLALIETEKVLRIKLLSDDDHVFFKKER